MLCLCFSQNSGEETSKLGEKPPICPSATLPASMENDNFGSRKARSSFGKGFFKIRGGKKTSSTPNLGESKPPDVVAIGLRMGLTLTGYQARE